MNTSMLFNELAKKLMQQGYSEFDSIIKDVSKTGLDELKKYIESKINKPLITDTDKLNVDINDLKTIGDLVENDKDTLLKITHDDSDDVEIKRLELAEECIRQGKSPFMLLLPMYIKYIVGIIVICLISLYVYMVTFRADLISAESMPIVEKIISICHVVLGHLLNFLFF